MTMTSQTKAYLEFVATNNVLPENPTLEDLRADAADYLKYAGPLSDDVHTEHTYFTSPTADLHAVIYRPKNVKPNAPALVSPVPPWATEMVPDRLPALIVSRAFETNAVVAN